MKIKFRVRLVVVLSMFAEAIGFATVLSVLWRLVGLPMGMPAAAVCAALGLSCVRLTDRYVSKSYESEVARQAKLAEEAMEFAARVIRERNNCKEDSGK